MFKTQQEVITRYEILISEVKTKLSIIKKSIDQLSFIRVGLLLAEIGAFVLFVSAKNDWLTLLGAVGLVIPIVAFVIVVKKQNRLIAHESYLKNILWVYQNEMNLLTGLNNGYDNGHLFDDGAHPYASDLDIFGKSSLFEMLNRCVTKKGNNKLALHLSEERHKDDILLRQVAVMEVAENIESTFDLRAKLKAHDPNKIEEIKQKLKGNLSNDLRFVQSSFLKNYIKFTPFLTIGLLVAGALFGGRFWGFMSLAIFCNATLVFFHMRAINNVYYGFGGGALILGDYAGAIAWTEERNWKSAYIRDLFESPEKVSGQIKELSKIIQAFDARLNILVAAVLNFFLVWDLRCCARIDQWHQQSSGNVVNALDRIGSFEDLISIATLNYNYPSWSYPIIESQFSLKAVAIGHPLIRNGKCIDNNFETLERPTVDIVTGSNMAGKSTFLRTLGVNMVLAYAGAPVCASNMQLSVFKLLSYMRIKDSLNENTSTFKAELNRLKMILDHVSEHKNSFVLIDEMLRGTNSKDKFMGSKVFIEKLISLNIPTLFATHDLQLSELKNIHEEAVRNFHFDIQIQDGEMNFDYKLKDGPCTIFNAAILLKQIGLVLDEEGI
ncbi:MAG: DNA mismatch repair protein MutS [Pedobacter sp.]|nr:MAG: DNA mismatch repair protein MutS [Pedobacter sp.]